MRVYEFARKFDKDSKDFLQELRSEFGFDIKSHLSGISQDQINAVILAYSSKDDLAVQVDDSHKQNLKEAFNETINLKEPEFISYDLVKDNEESKQKESDAQIAENKTKTLLEETQSWWEKLLLWIKWRIFSRF